MPIARFNGERHLNGGAMSFETYLKQINLLYPYVPDMYVKYIKMINDFDAGQIERLLKIQAFDLSNDLFSNILNSLQSVKTYDYELFMAFVAEYDLKNRVIELFEIEEGEQVESTNYHMEFGTSELKPIMYFDFNNTYLYTDIKSVTFGVIGEEGYGNSININAKPIINEGFYTGLEIYADWDESINIPKLDISIQAICFGEVVVVE